jgi:putative SOS response-associated peptidase YedK
MCGRYDLSDNPAAIQAKFSVPHVPEFAPNADVRPTQSNPIVRIGTDGARECVLARWGLVPSWAKDAKFGTRCINARIETIDTAPAFRSAWRRRRCLVPVNGFYEWSGPVGRRIKWRITLNDEPLFALAGLWEGWRDPQGSEVETYTIITTDANAVLAPIHDRMPVIVGPEHYADWLATACPPQKLAVAAGIAGLRVEPT